VKGKKRSNIPVPETLNEILDKAMRIYKEYEDLGVTIFLFGKNDVYEIPLVGEESKKMALEFSKKDVVGIAIAGKFDVQESSLLQITPTLGIGSIGIMYHSTTDDYFFYTKILHHDLSKDVKFKFSEIKRVSRRDGFQLTESFLNNIFPILH